MVLENQDYKIPDSEGLEFVKWFCFYREIPFEKYWKQYKEWQKED